MLFSIKYKTFDRAVLSGVDEMDKVGGKLSLLGEIGEVAVDAGRGRSGCVCGTL